ncbi:MAG: indole-3-glycerol phosphate synthase TrpC [SAR202 cluster bacterium]|nr:indole-3-glycerol phosphate synthase TrpC [SAR202 cluster bacterium]
MRRTYKNQSGTLLKKTENILSEIVKKRLIDIEQKKTFINKDELIYKCNQITNINSLEKKINTNKNMSVIAEMKRSSPSAGILKENLIPKNRAKEYHEFGATGISVLTEPDFFNGSILDLKEVAKISKPNGVPLLCKDFIIDEYQIYEAKANGADCILLIIGILEPEQYKILYALCKQLELDVIVEIFDEKELDIAMEISPKIIGINNRNLKTLNTSLEVFVNLSKYIPDNIIKIAESGMKNIDDIKCMKDYGANGILIGETLMKQNNDLSSFMKKITTITSK